MSRFGDPALDAVRPTILAKPKPVNAPNLVNFTGVPEGMQGNPYYGEGLAGISSARDALAKAAGGGLERVREPFGGAGYLLDQLSGVIDQNRARSAETATRNTLAQIMGGIDPAKGPTSQDIQAAMQADPAFGEKLYAQLVAMQGKEHWTQLPDGRQQNTVTGEIKDAGSTGATKLSDISTAIGHVEQLPSYKNMAQATPIWSSLVDAATRDTAQSDLNIILGMAKLFDPQSVVRTSEGEAVQQTAGLPTEIFSAWKYLSGQPGSRLDAYKPGMRDALLAEGYSRMQGYNDAWQRDRQQWTDFATRHNIDPRDLLLESFPALAEWKAKEQPAPTDPNATTDPNVPADPNQPDWPPKVGFVAEGKGGIKYRFKGGDPNDKGNWEPVGAPRANGGPR